MKHMHKNISIYLVILASILFVLVGCSDMMVKMGEIVLQVEPEDTIRTTVATYSITGNLEGSRSSINLSNLLPSEEVVIPNIAPGKWTFTVTAHDDTNTDIGSGTKGIVLIEGQKVNLKVPVVFVPLSLTITTPTIPNLSKVYDGNNTLAVTAGTLNGVVVGDTVSVTAIATYNDKSVGSGKVITVVHTLSYADDTAITGKYAPPADYTISIGEITKKPLSINAPIFPSSKNKVYDGTNALPVTAGSLIGIVEGDDVSVVATATYVDENAEDSKILTVTYTLSGADAGSYIKPANNTETGNIAKKPLTFTVTSDDKSYDGNTTAIGTVSLIGVLEDDANDVGATGTFTFSDKNVGPNKSVSVNGIVLGGTRSGNYSLAEATASTTATIIKAEYDMSGIFFDDASPTYDGNTHPLAIRGTLPGGVTVSYSSNNTSVQAGAHEVTASFGVDTANHETIPEKRAILEIQKRTLTSGGTYLTLSKAYDKNASVYSTLDQEASGKVSGDDMLLTVSASYDDKSGSIGENKGITVSYAMSGSDANNYTKPADYSVTTGSIKPIQLTISNPSFSNTSKIYDGNDRVPVTAGTLNGVLSGDSDMVSVTAIAGYGDKNVGINKAITVAYGLEGIHAANYIAPENYTVYTGVITRKALTVVPNSTLVELSKTYDGTLSSEVTNPGTLQGVANGEDVNLVASATYATKDVGSDKAITITYSISGSDAANYTVSSNTALTGTITKKVLTVQSGTTQISAEKLYDGTASAEVTDYGTLQGVPSGEDVNLVASATYATNDVGSNKTITITYTLSGSDAENYTAPANNTSFTGRITNGQLSISDPVLVKTKIYNSSNDCIVFPGNAVQGVIGNDSVQVQAIATYNDKNVGTGKDIRVVYTLIGRDSGKYLAPVDFVANDGEIQHKQLSITAPTIPSTSKPYDGSTSVEFTPGTVTGVCSGDTVHVATNGFYLSFSVDDNKRIFFTYTLGGSDAANYRSPLSEVIKDAAITRKALTVVSDTTVITTEKLYDKSTIATVNTVGTLIGVVGTEEVILEATAVYEDVNVGEDKDIRVTYTLSGRDAAKYSTPAPYTVRDGKITKRTLTIAEPSFPDGKDRVYDGTTALNVTAGSLVGVLGGDTVTVDATATYADNNVSATAKVITVSYGLSGSDAGNYTKPVDDTSNTGTISKAVIDMSGVIYEPEIFTYNGKYHSFTNPNILPPGVGSSYSGKTYAGTYSITITFTISDWRNYELSQQSTTATMIIQKKPLTVSAGLFGKTYDGNTNATGTLSLSGVEECDIGNVGVYGNFVFSDANAGILKTVNVTGIALSGTKASNYSLVSTTATGSVSITPKPLTISAVSVDDKPYDGNANATGTLTLGGKVGTDDVRAIGNFAFSDVNAGTSKTVNVTGIALSGTKASNYSLSVASTTAQATITKATYNMDGIAFTGATRTYDGNMHQLAISGTLPFGVTVSYSDNNRNTNAGTYEVTASFTGNTTNYNTISSKTATLTIQKASMTGGLSINGTAKEGQILTYNASLSVGSNPSYQWKRNGNSIAGATGTSYTLVTADVGNTISVTATATGSNYTGSITSASTAVVVSNGPAAPAGTIVAYNPASPSDQNIINLTGFVANTTGLEAAVSLTGGSYASYQALAVDGRGRARIYVSGNAIANTSKVKVRVASIGAVSAGTDKEITIGASRVLSVGDYYQGGLVAYLSISGDPIAIGKGLIVAETTLGNKQWYNVTGSVLGVDKVENESIGAGFTNTEAIIAKGDLAGFDRNSYAAGFARAYTGGSKTDWFLPSRKELQKLYDNRGSLGGFIGGPYWSSTESTESWGNSVNYSAADYAASRSFDYAVDWVDDKTWSLVVLPVRYF